MALAVGLGGFRIQQDECVGHRRLEREAELVRSSDVAVCMRQHVQPPPIGFQVYLGGASSRKRSPLKHLVSISITSRPPVVVNSSSPEPRTAQAELLSALVIVDSNHSTTAFRRRMALPASRLEKRETVCFVWIKMHFLQLVIGREYETGL